MQRSFQIPKTSRVKRKLLVSFGEFGIGWPKVMADTFDSYGSSSTVKRSGWLEVGCRSWEIKNLVLWPRGCRYTWTSLWDGDFSNSDRPFSTLALSSFNAFVVLSRSEASCSSAIATAKAVTEEAGDAVSRSLHVLAEQCISHSEHSFHKVIAEFGLALDVKMTTVKVDEFGSFPVLLMSDWLHYVLNLVIQVFETELLAVFFATWGKRLTTFDFDLTLVVMCTGGPYFWFSVFTGSCLKSNTPGRNL